MSKWFGEPWPSAELRAPICEDDTEHVDTPTGKPCLLCGEEIVTGDRGISMPYLAMEEGKPVNKDCWVHIECNMRSVIGGIGHLKGVCSCRGGAGDPDMGLSYRESALQAWEWVGAHGMS